MTPCPYCGTPLVVRDDGDEPVESESGKFHYIATCREYVAAALRATRQEVERLALECAHGDAIGFEMSAELEHFRRLLGHLSGDEQQEWDKGYEQAVREVMSEIREHDFNLYQELRARFAGWRKATQRMTEMKVIT